MEGRRLLDGGIRYVDAWQDAVERWISSRNRRWAFPITTLWFSSGLPIARQVAKLYVGHQLVRLGCMSHRQTREATTSGASAEVAASVSSGPYE